jgi:prevent-host-death family protein
MNIIPSAEIRQNYGNVAKLCKDTHEPVYLTNRGKGELVVMDIDAFNRREQLFKIKEKLLEVEEMRALGIKDYTLEELDKHLENIISDKVDVDI